MIKLFSLATLCFSFGSKDKITAFTSSVLQVQQFYNAGIPLLEAYILPMANNRTRKERLPQNKMAASNVVQIHTHARFP